MLQSIESRQRQYFNVLLSNRDDRDYLKKMIHSQTRKSQANANPSTPNFQKRLDLERSELEVVSDTMDHAQVPGIFTSAQQAKLYRLLVLELVNSSDELFTQFLDYALYQQRDRAPSSLMPSASLISSLPSESVTN